MNERSLLNALALVPFVAFSGCGDDDATVVPTGDPQVPVVTVVAGAGFVVVPPVPRLWPIVEELEGGLVLVAGGLLVPDGASQDARLYDLENEQVISAGDLVEGRRQAASARLPDGKVLVVGGTDTTSAELYDPTTNMFSLLPDTMTVVRANPYAVLLTSGPHAGKVLIMGGELPPFTAELYDPSTGKFTAHGTADAPGYRPNATTALDDGRLLFSGVPDGTSSNGTLHATRCYVYDPATESFTETGAFGRSRPDHTATKLGDGRVLVVGGHHSDPIGSAEIWDPSTGEWTASDARLTTPRSRHMAARLGGGLVVIAGGNTTSQTIGDQTDDVEVYDPEDDRFFAAEGTLQEPLIFAAARALSDGRVMILGGQTNGINHAAVDFVAEE
jgi:hypothetical protein